MLRRSIVCALAATLGVALAACGTPSSSPEVNPKPSTSATKATGGHHGGGGGLTLPENAPPRARKAYENAKAAEEKRDRIQARAMEVVRQHPPPSLSPAGGSGEPGEPANPCAEGNGGATCDPSEECVSDCPSGAAEPPGEAPAPAAAPTVPPEVKAAMNAWAQAQRDHRAACGRAAAELNYTDDSGIGHMTSPLCAPDDPLPDDFKQWLAILGYNVDDLIYKGV